MTCYLGVPLGMYLFIGVLTLYLGLAMLAIVYAQSKGWNMFFWGLITYIFSPFVTIICIYFLGDSESKKEEDAQSALMSIKLLEYEVINDWENKGYLLPHLKKRGEARMEEQRMIKESEEEKPPCISVVC